MRIAQISKADSYGGGASHVAELLYNGLRESNYFVHHLTSWSGKGYEESRYPLYGRYEREIRKLHLLTKKLAVPELLPYEMLTLKRHDQRSNYNLLHFHDLSSAISPLTLHHLSKKVPVLWTIHDCSAVTAGCLYPMGCEKYKSTCVSCPQKGQWPMDSKIDLSFIGHYMKKILHKTGRINLVTPSQWMADFIHGSGLVDHDIKVISNGIDTSAFTPSATSDVGEKISRKRGIKVLLSSGDILDERKGIKFSLQVLKKLKHLNPVVIVAGNVSDEAKKLFSEFETFYAGYVSDKQVMASLYSTADIFLFCSLADNQPLAVMESLASGTPVYGFKTGGIPEMIMDGANGHLVEQMDVGGLARIIENDLNAGRIKPMSIAARNDAVKKYDVNFMVDNYISHYENLVSKFLSCV